MGHLRPALATHYTPDRDLFGFSKQSHKERYRKPTQPKAALRAASNALERMKQAHTFAEITKRHGCSIWML